MTLDETARERLADVRELEPTSNGELRDRWGMDSGKEVAAYLDDVLGEDMFRDDESRIARSIRDLDRTVDRLREHGVELHVVSEELVIRPADDNDPFQRAMWQLLGVFAELEASITQQRVREGLAARMDTDEYHQDPAPLGIEKDSGRLVEGEEYDRVVTVLDMVEMGDMSKRQAALELDSSRRTINRSLERAELYGI